MEQSMDYRIDMAEHSVWNVISATPYVKQNLMYLQETGLFHAGPGYYTTVDGLESFSIKLTLSGKGTLLRGAQQYQLSRGDFFWIDCREPQHYQTADDSDHWDILWIRFYGAGAENYHRMFKLLHNDCPVGHLPDNNLLQEKMESLLTMHQNHSAGLLADIRCANLLAQLLSGLLETVSAGSDLPVPPPIIYNVQEYLMEHYAEPITLDDLSKRFNLSKFYLQRTFTRCIGLSPQQYRQNIRLTQAKKLLRTTNTPINLIAAQVGFETTSSFITAFKKFENTTPLKYRTDWSDDNAF